VARSRAVLLDTGFLVALVNAADPDHAACARVWDELRARVVTVEGVLVEAAHLLRPRRRARGGQEAAMSLVLAVGAAIVPLDAERLARASALMARYHDVPMDLVDALLVTTAEQLAITEVLTLDRRGFGAYRLGRGRGFAMLP
jgi:predicted nucleic acid-binding protein